VASRYIILEVVILSYTHVAGLADTVLQVQEEWKAERKVVRNMMPYSVLLESDQDLAQVAQVDVRELECV
jgi:hypothetical protein